MDEYSIVIPRRQGRAGHRITVCMRSFDAVRLRWWSESVGLVQC